MLIGASRSEPHTIITHTRKLLYLYMYVCSDMSSMCSSCSMRVHILKSVKIVNIDCMLTLIVAHQSRSQYHSSVNSQQVIAGRDLENNLLKGRRSSTLFYKAIMIIVSIINDNLCSVVQTVQSVVTPQLCLHMQD